MIGEQWKADGENNNKEKNNFFCPFPIFTKPVDRWHVFGSKSVTHSDTNKIT